MLKMNYNSNSHVEYKVPVSDVIVGILGYHPERVFEDNENIVSVPILAFCESLSSPAAVRLISEVTSFNGSRTRRQLRDYVEVGLDYLGSKSLVDFDPEKMYFNWKYEGGFLPKQFFEQLVVPEWELSDLEVDRIKRASNLVFSDLTLKV